MVHKTALSLLLGSLPCLILILLEPLAAVGPPSIVGDPWASCRHDSANRATGPRVAMPRRSLPTAVDPLPNHIVADPPLLAGFWMEGSPSFLETRGKLDLGTQARPWWREESRSMVPRLRAPARRSPWLCHPGSGGSIVFFYPRLSWEAIS